jgi:hypothetical protein
LILRSCHPGLYALVLLAGAVRRTLRKTLD